MPSSYLHQILGWLQVFFATQDLVGVVNIVGFVGVVGVVNIVGVVVLFGIGCLR